ncbi:hypothetical protein HUW62_02685 [Myxococcus sp. AM011]|uniref:GspE/PulE/PilB domain-containing protein n=1 Tax=Myxococcus sp. AM011 TaxID=2745200 RepID=UPI001594F6D1|nr:hypothetical protein [Myxococcus sp. AM011]NVJ20129.1 hypothetical protein [Myxococcus sp. AM011]
MAEKLGAILVRKGLLTQAQLDEALKAQLIYGGRLGSILVELEFLDIDTLAMVLGEQTRYPVAQEADFEAVTDATLTLLPAALAEKHLAFPLAQEGRRLKVAMASPFEIQHTDALGFITGLRILPHITPELRLFQYQAQRYGIRRESRSMSMGMARRAAQPRGAAAPPAPARGGVMVPLPDVAPPPAPVRAEPGTEGIFGGLAPGQFLSDDAEDVAAEDVQWSASSAPVAGNPGDGLVPGGSARPDAGPPVLAPAGAAKPSGPPQLASVDAARGMTRPEGPPRLAPAGPPRLAPPVMSPSQDAPEEIEPEEEFEAAEEIDPTEELELVDSEEEVLEGVMEEVVEPPAPRSPVFAGPGASVADGAGGSPTQPPGMVSRQWSPHQPPGLNRAPGAGGGAPPPPGSAGARPPPSVVGPPGLAGAVRPGVGDASVVGASGGPGASRPGVGDASVVGASVVSGAPSLVPSGAPANAGAARPGQSFEQAAPVSGAVPPGMVGPGGRPPSGTGVPSVPQGPGARPPPGAAMAPAPGPQGTMPPAARPPSAMGTPVGAGPVPPGMVSTRPSSAGMPPVQGSVPPGMAGARPPSSAGMPPVQGASGPAGAPVGPGPQGPVPPGMMGARPPSSAGMPPAPGLTSAPGVSGPQGSVPPGMMGARPPSSAGMPSVQGPPGPAGVGAPVGQGPVPPGMAGARLPPGAPVVPGGPPGLVGAQVPPGMLGARPPSSTGIPSAPGAVGSSGPMASGPQGPVPPGMMGTRPPSSAGMIPSVPGPQGPVPPGMARPLSGPGPQGAVPPGIRPSSSGLPAVSGPPGAVPPGMAGARPPSGTGLPVAPGPQGGPPGANVAAGGRPASAGSGPMGQPPPGMQRPPQAGAPPLMQAGAVPQAGGAGFQPPGMAPKGVPPATGASPAAVAQPNTAPTPPRGTDVVIPVPPGESSLLDAERPGESRLATESVPRVEDTTSGLASVAGEGAVGLPSPSGSDARLAGTREVRVTDAPGSWSALSEGSTFAAAAAVVAEREGSAASVTTGASASPSVASEVGAPEVAASAVAPREDNKVTSTSWSITRETSADELEALAVAAREAVKKASTSWSIASEAGAVDAGASVGASREAAKPASPMWSIIREAGAADAPAPRIAARDGGAEAATSGNIASEAGALDVDASMVASPDGVTDAPSSGSLASEAALLDVASSVPATTEGSTPVVAAEAFVSSDGSEGPATEGAFGLPEGVHGSAAFEKPVSTASATALPATEQHVVVANPEVLTPALAHEATAASVASDALSQAGLLAAPVPLATSTEVTRSETASTRGVDSSETTPSRDVLVPTVETVAASATTGAVPEEPTTLLIASTEAPPSQTATFEPGASTGDASEHVSSETAGTSSDVVLVAPQVSPEVAASEGAAPRAPEPDTSTEPASAHAGPPSAVEQGEGPLPSGPRGSTSTDPWGMADSSDANPSPSSEQSPSATEATSVAYLDLGLESASTLDVSPTGSVDSSHGAQDSSSTIEGEPWKLVRSVPSNTGRAHEQHEPPTSDAALQPKVITGDEDISESLELEAAGSMLASHGEPSSHVGATTQRGADTSLTTVLPDSASKPSSVAASDLETPDLQHSSDPRGTESGSTARDDASKEAGPSSTIAMESQVSTEATVVSLDAVRAANAESSGALIPGPSGSVEPVPSTPALRPVATRRAPIELDDLPATDDSPMQLASTWEFVGWQGSDGSGTIGHVAENTWDDRAVDLDGAVPRAAPAGASSSELPLASAWDFIQQPWQPQAREQSEALTALLAASDAPTGTGSEGPTVSAEQVLTALEDVGTQGVLGKVLLAYCAGRFQRAFLLGESFGLVRVGHAWGPGSDSPQVSALKVDLEAPSLLMSSLGQLGPSSFDTPSCVQDEAIFSALGGPSSRLLVMPIRARGRPVAFVIADSGGEPVATTTLDELTRVSAKASEVYDRLPASRAD